MGKDYKQFYLLAKESSDGTQRSNAILNTTLAGIARDPAYLELYNSFNAGRDEIAKMKLIRNENFRSALNENLKESLGTQRNLIGNYVRGQLQLNAAQIAQSFEDMSYIKLEVLSKRKTELYDNAPFISEGGSRTRGNFSYLRKLKC